MIASRPMSPLLVCPLWSYDWRQDNVPNVSYFRSPRPVRQAYLAAVTSTDADQITAEQRDLHGLLGYLGRADAWSRYTGSGPSVWAVQRDSALACDDARTHPYRVSHGASRAITAAVDHFAGLRAMIMGPSDQASTIVYLRPYAPMTLLRAAIENAATSVWLLAPTDGDERTMRALQLGAGEVKNREAARALTGTVGAKTRDQYLDRIRGLARGLGLDPKTAVRRPDYADIVNGGAVHLGINGDAAEAIWRACSGLAHGDLWPVLNVLDTADALSSADVATKEITANTKILAHAAGLSVALIDGALRLYGERRSRP